MEFYPNFILTPEHGGVPGGKSRCARRDLARGALPCAKMGIALPRFNVYFEADVLRRNGTVDWKQPSGG